MKVRSRYRRYIAFAAIIVVVLSCALLSWLRSVDFVDNPALLVDVSLHGEVSVETKDGMITAALAGVTGPVRDQDKQAFDHVVASAKRDFVAFRVRANKTLEIWYVNADGETRSLNRDVASVCTKIHE